MGTQYRSAIFYASESQRADIEASRAALAIASQVVTQVVPMDDDFIWEPAEAYHQRYLEKGGQSARVGSLEPIQCYGGRGPIKKMDKPAIKAILKGEL